MSETMRSMTNPDLTLCLIFSAILAGILINLPGAIEAVRDLFGV